MDNVETEDVPLPRDELGRSLLTAQAAARARLRLSCGTWEPANPIRRPVEHERFDFLGYEFRPRLSRSKHGKRFVSFTSAVSAEARKEIGQRIRNWHLHKRSDETLEDLARMANAIVRGWIKPLRALLPVRVASTSPAHQRVPHSLGRTEVQAVTGPHAAGERVLGRRRQTRADALCSLAVRSGAVRLGNGSRVRGDPQARFCEGRGVQLPPATHRLARPRGRTSRLLSSTMPRHPLRHPLQAAGAQSRTILTAEKFVKS